MKIAFFAVPALGGGEAEAEVNRFLGAHRVVSLDRQLVGDGRGAYWALAVTYLEGTIDPAVLRRGKIDYREVLSEEDFAVYSRLRALRKEIATLQPVLAEVEALGGGKSCVGRRRVARAVDSVARARRRPDLSCELCP